MVPLGRGVGTALCGAERGADAAFDAIDGFDGGSLGRRFVDSGMYRYWQ